MKYSTLQDKHQGEKCIVLGCGPSFNSYSPDKLRTLGKSYTILGIKQAFVSVPDIIQYHFLNSNNICGYNYSKHCPVRVLALTIGENNSRQYKILEYDIKLLIWNNTNFAESLSHNLNFDDWTLEKTPLRPWGPGIMYEVVFFFCLYLGFSDIYTIGWDLGDKGSTTRDHFYDMQVINPAFKLSSDEAEREIQLTQKFYHWLQKQGTNLYIANEGSYAHEDIPRVIL